MRHHCARAFWLPKGAASGFQRKYGSPHLASVSPHPSPHGVSCMGPTGLTHCTCPTEKSQDGCVAFVTLTTGSASLALMSFISQARLKGPLAPGTVPVTEVVGASVGPNGDGGAGCGGPVSKRLSSLSFQLPALWGGAGTRLSAPPDKTPENNMLFPLLPGCARAVFTVGEGASIISQCLSLPLSEWQSRQHRDSVPGRLCLPYPSSS